MSRNATFRGANLQYVAAPTSLTGLSDVTVASAANLDRLQYSTSAGKWVDVAALTTPQIEDSSADHQYVFAVSELAADRTITLPLLTGNDTFTFNAFAATLTNKTLTSPVLNTGVSGSAVLDQDDMSGNSATQLATQQSIKAYVDAQVATEDTLAELNDTTISGPASNDVLQYSGSAWVDRTYAEAGLVSLTGSETLTNKTLTSPVLNGGALTALTDLDMTSGDKTILDTIGANTLTIGASGTTVTIPGNLTVSGTQTTVSTTNLLVSDKLITLNDGGSASSGTAVGIEVEEDSSVTGYFKTAADRAGWELKAPGTAGVLSIDPSANSNTLAFGGSGKTFTISETATIDQDLATTANVTFANLTATGNVTLGNAASDTVTITGTIQGASPLVFEGGTADGYETTLAITDPTADRTWTLPNATDTFVGLATADTLSNKTLASPVITTGDINTPDIDGGTVDAITSLTIANNVDVGSYTVRASGFLADGLTAGQVVYTGADGVLSSEAALTYNATTNILTAGEVSMTTLDIGGTNVSSTAAELNILDGVTSTAAELNILDGVTSTAAELNILDGVTSTAAEINLLDGSSANSVVNSKAVIYGSSGELAGTLSTAAQTNVTSLGTLTALTVDNVAINGTTIGHTGDTDLMTLAAGTLTLAGNIDLANNHVLNVGGAGNDWTATFKHTNSSPTATYAFNLRTSSGGGGLTVSPITQLASGSMEFFIQDFDTVTLTGSDPTTYSSVHASRFQGFAYTATNANQTVTNARTMVLQPVVSNGGGGATPTITTASTLYIATGGSAGATNYALFVDAGTSRFDGAISLGTDHGDDGQQLTSGGDDTACDWTAASSLKEHKDIGEQASPEEALEAMLSTPAYHFRYKERKGTGDSSTEYVGVMADEAPWAMHYKGNIVNPVNTLGYTVLSVQALHAQIEKLDKRLELAGV